MKTNKTIEERLEAAVVDALQRYPDMHPLAREHFVNYLLTGENDGTLYMDIRVGHLRTRPWSWLVPLRVVRANPAMLGEYSLNSGYKETLTNETDD